MKIRSAAASKALGHLEKKFFKFFITNYRRYS
jgi:hypothetical protein